MSLSASTDRGAFVLTVALLAAIPLLDGCAPAVIAVGVGYGAVVANDQRSTGAQLDDQTIEFKVSTAAGSRSLAGGDSIARSAGRRTMPRRRWLCSGS